MNHAPFTYDHVRALGWLAVHAMVRATEKRNPHAFPVSAVIDYKTYNNFAIFVGFRAKLYIKERVF